MMDNRYLDSLICTELGIKDFFELSNWDYNFFTDKMKKMEREQKRKLKKDLPKEDLKDYVKAQRIYIKRLKYVRRNYSPLKMKLKLEELNNVGTFVSLRMDFLEIKNILKDIDDYDKEKECNKYIEKYNLDKNKDFIKHYDANFNVKDEILLSKIGSWMNGYIEYFYDNSLMSNDIIFDENLNISVKTTYLRKQSEIGENIKNNIQTKLRRTWDYILYFALLLISIALFIVGSSIDIDKLQNLIYSLAITFLATFLINVLNNMKLWYYEYRINQIKDLLTDIADCKRKIDICLEDYKNAKDFENKIEVFLDYKFDVDYYLKYIKKLIKFIIISGEPFTNNYFSLKRYNEYIMTYMYSKIKHLYEFKNGKYTFINPEKNIIEKIEENIKESILGTHLIISDLYESIKFSIDDKLAYYEKLKK